MASFISTASLNGRALAAPAERRASVRHACQMKGAWRPLGSQGTVWEALIQDVSVGGMSLLMDASFKRGTILAVKLDCPGERFARPVLMRVAHCKQEEDGLWGVGCSFASQLKEKDLKALLAIAAVNMAAGTPPDGPPPLAQEPQRRLHDPAADPFLTGSRSEFRRTPRRGGASITVYINRAGSTDRPIEGWIVNRSLGGLCLCSPKRFDEDLILRVKPKRGGDHAPTVEVRVKGFREEGDRWMIHCQFTIQPSAQTMMMFG